MSFKTTAKQLREIVELQRGNTYKSRLKGQPGPMLLGLASIRRNGGFRDDNLTTYGGDSPESLLLRPGDLFVSLKDVTQAADLLGSVALVPDHIKLGRLTQDTVKLIFKSNEFDPSFVYWILRTPQYRSYCRSHSTGTTNLGLSREDFLSFQIPPQSESRLAIVEILNLLEDKIELNRRMNETLESMARALFKSWFVDFDPVRAKMDGRQPPGLSAEVAALFPDKLVHVDGELVPEGWGRVPLGELAELLSGGTPRKGTAAYWDGDVPWISPKSMNEIHVYDSDEHVTSAAIGNGTRLVPRGSVLVMVRGMGLHKGVRISQTQRDVTFNQDVKALVPRDISGTLLLYALLGSSAILFSKVQASGHGTGVLPTDILQSLEFIFPNRFTLSRLSPTFENTNSQIAANSRESITLSQIRDTLLPRLLSGDLRFGESLQAT